SLLGVQLPREARRHSLFLGTVRVYFSAALESLAKRFARRRGLDDEVVELARRRERSRASRPDAQDSAAASTRASSGLPRDSGLIHWAWICGAVGAGPTTCEPFRIAEVAQHKLAKAAGMITVVDHSPELSLFGRRSRGQLRVIQTQGGSRTLVDQTDAAAVE